MTRSLSLALVLVAWIGVVPLSAQEVAAQVEMPWPLQLLVFVVSLPYTLFMIFVDGQRMHLLPAPLIAVGLCVWSLNEWRRQGFWTPRIVHVMAGLALATIIAINVAWVSAGGEMIGQRYVVIVLFGVFPYVVYLMFLGPKFIGRRRAPAVVDAEEEGLAREIAEVRSATPLEETPWSRSWARPPTPTRAIAASALGSGAAASTAASADVERGRRAPGPPKRQRRSPLLTAFYVLFGGVALIAVGSSVAGAVAESMSRPFDDRPDLAVLRAPEDLVPGVRGVVLGDPDAPVTIVEFGDYQCPGCGRFALQDKPEIERAYIETGRAKFVFFDLPLRSLHDNAFEAARSARCADEQDAFWAYHEEVLAQQAAWSELVDPSPAFLGYAGAVGLDTERFGDCLASGRHADVVEANEALADRLDINSTPTIVVFTEDGGPLRSRTARFRTVSLTVEALVGGRTNGGGG